MNNIILIGRLTSDLKVVEKSGYSFTKGTIVVNRKTSKGESIADFIPFIAWGNNATILSKFTLKGSLIAIMGSLRSSSYKDENGNNRTSLEVNVDSFKLLSNLQKKDSNEQGGFRSLADSVDDYGFIEITDVPF